MGLPTVKEYEKNDWANAEAERLLGALTPEERASQLIMAAIDGKEGVPPGFRTRFDDCVPGAVLLFRYNVAETPERVFAFLTAIQRAFSSLGLPVLFAIDHEGGTVYRTGTVTTRLPAQAEIAENHSPEQALGIYSSAARELWFLGIRMDLAPVAETGNADNAGFLGSRLFGNDGAAVIAYSSAAVRGITDSGLIATVKHFPGNTAADPHTGAARIDMGKGEFEGTVLRPFRAILSQSPGAVLVSHVTVDCVDPGIPFCLSERGVQGILRGELGYNGLVVTDDVSMGAMADAGYSPAEAAVLAVDAGCDLVMTSDPEIRAVRDAIVARSADEEKFANKVNLAVQRVLRAKIAAGMPVTSLGRYALSRGSPVLPFDSQGYNETRAHTLRALEETK